MVEEYISREALKELFDGIYDCADLVFEPDDQICSKQYSSCGSCRWGETKRAIQKRVMSIPAADVRPVVHGKWISKYPLSTCSVCEKSMILCDFANFCPNCGADMRPEQPKEET